MISSFPLNLSLDGRGNEGEVGEGQERKESGGVLFVSV
jgi:hypothetical protein